MTFEEYEARFQAECDKIQLGSGCSVLGPFLHFTVDPDLPPWKLELYIVFEDGMYLLLREIYGNIAGNPKEGQRLQFSFHYGLTPQEVDSEGRPLWRLELSCTIRIDRDDWHGPHMHYDGENHISQDRVKNMNIMDMTPFVFLKGILEHRKSHHSLPEIFGFEIE